MYGFGIVKSLVSGYTRELNEKYIIEELLALCSKYCANTIPDFNLFSNKPQQFNPKDIVIHCNTKQLTTTIENRNDNQSITRGNDREWRRDPIYGSRSNGFDLWFANVEDTKPDPQNSYRNRNKQYRNIYGVATVPWNKKQWCAIARNDIQYDYIYNFKMEIKKNFNSFGIGIISDDHKYKYCICTEIHYDPQNESQSKAWTIIKHKTPKPKHRYYREKHNEKRILLPKVGDSLCVTLNFKSNTIQYFCNDKKIESVEIEHIKDLNDVTFYPTFCFIPNLYYTDDPHHQTYQVSQFEIKTCHLDKVEKDYIAFNECIVDVGWRDNVFTYDNWSHWMKFDNCVTASILGIELTGFTCEWGRKNHQMIKEPEKLFDMLWKGYYINFINLEEFDDTLDNLMYKIWAGFDEDYAMLKYGGTNKSAVPKRWEQYEHDELYTLSYKWEHFAFIIVHLWTLIEMFQHFRNEYYQLIYNTLINRNSLFMCDGTISHFVTNIITNYTHQNLGDDPEKCFRNDEFYKIFSKIYMRTFYDCSGSHMIYPNSWLDDNVLCTLNIPKEYMIAYEYVSDTSFRWKYYYISKETIEYTPGIAFWNGEDIKGKRQRDWYCNPLMLSYDLAKLFVNGVIHELCNNYNSKTYTETTVNFIVMYVLKYYFTIIPQFKHWGNALYSKPLIKPNKIEFDCSTGIVTVTAYKDPNKNTKKYWSMNTCEGVWKKIGIERMRHNYIHKLEMKCIANFNHFAIGITKGMDRSSSWLLCVEQRKKSKKAKLCVLEINDDDEDDEMNALEKVKQEIVINRFKCGNTLSLIMDYNTENVTFYYNDKRVCTMLPDKYPELRKENESVSWYHPLIGFKSQDYNEKERVSKYKITSCHLISANEEMPKRITPITTKRNKTKQIGCNYVGNLFDGFEEGVNVKDTNTNQKNIQNNKRKKKKHSTRKRKKKKKKTWKTYSLQ